MKSPFGRFSFSGSLFLSIALMTLLGETKEVQAARQWRCNGLIQYHPCGEPFPGGKSGFIRAPYSSSAPIHRSSRDPKPYQPTIPPQLLESSFEQRPSGDGHWYGKIHGEGRVALYLNLFSKDKLIEKRYMGAVVLNGIPSSFNFLSSLPKERVWSWEVEVKGSHGRHTAS